jgi:thiol-disulfide isomerase/thioredoxin
MRYAILLTSAAFLLLPTGARAQKDSTAGGIRDKSVSEALDMVRGSKGSVVVFHLYASWCPPCKNEFPDVVRIAERYKNHNFRMLAFSVDQRLPDLQRFLDDKDPVLERLRLASAKNLPAALQELGMRYTGAIPYTAIFDTSGKLAEEWIGSRDYRVYVTALDKQYRTAPPTESELKPLPATPRTLPTEKAEEKAQPTTPEARKESSSAWLFYVVGFGVLVLAAGLIAYRRLAQSAPRPVPE